MLISKIILLIPFMFLSCKITPQKGIEQVQMQNLDTNDNEVLSTEEAELLNSLLENLRDTFDFHRKKVAFITGSSRSRILSKSDYFNDCIKPWLNTGKAPQLDILIVLFVQQK